MKIIRNNVCYVEVEDLLWEPIPKFPDNIPTDLSTYEIISFTSEEAIVYFKEREDIIDFDFISKLSPEELEGTIDEIKEKMTCSAEEWLDASERERAKLDQNSEYQQRARRLKRAYVCLRKYKLCKKDTDLKMKQFIEKISKNILLEEFTKENQSLKKKPSND